MPPGVNRRDHTVGKRVHRLHRGNFLPFFGDVQLPSTYTGWSIFCQHSFKSFDIGFRSYGGAMYQVLRQLVGKIGRQ